MSQATKCPAWRQYEYYTMHYHATRTKLPTWHWSQLPRHHLVESGCLSQIQSKHHLMRNDIPRVMEYGLDGLAYDAETGVYTALQAKYNLKSKLSARSLGTFFHAVLRMRSHDVRVKSCVYYAGKIAPELACDLDIMKKKYDITFEHVHATADMLLRYADAPTNPDHLRFFGSSVR